MYPHRNALNQLLYLLPSLHLKIRYLKHSILVNVVHSQFMRIQLGLPSKNRDGICGLPKLDPELLPAMSWLSTLACISRNNCFIYALDAIISSFSYEYVTT